MPTYWTKDKEELLQRGIARITKFCTLNNIPIPDVHSATDWGFSACAYYRWEGGIRIHLPSCQVPCGVEPSRNWTWPSSTTDREPYGVIAHELGHHVDMIWGKETGAMIGRYSSEQSTVVMQTANEPPITSYCPNDAEWFAEMFRLLITNPGLLQQLRPRTFKVLTKRWEPIGMLNWKIPLGTNVPSRVVKALMNKGAK